MPGSTFVHAPRQTNAITASAERRLLLWMARRLPPWIGSDHLTLLAFLAMVAGGLSFWAAGHVHRFALFGVVIALVVNWFGDSLDGTVARVRDQQRPRYGFYVDHIVDAIGTVCLLGGLALSGYMHPGLALGLLVAYLTLSVEVHLATYCAGTFRLSYWRLGPTELRIVLAAGTLALLADPTVAIFGERYRLFDVGGAVAIAGLTLTIVVSVVHHVRLLYRLEPLPPRGVDRRGPVFSGERVAEGIALDEEVGRHQTVDARRVAHPDGTALAVGSHTGTDVARQVRDVPLDRLRMPGDPADRLECGTARRGAHVTFESRAPVERGPAFGVSGSIAREPRRASATSEGQA
jgi:archaetidylinositol phosphate synthase